ncbi:hypothetical protein [Desertibacillus haloalkaliphilus]|uniref:hypothetical protein n=1 Tax=Desertibacillus haloalkaliphilus TaxID=1328930 RepID=UPI001C2518A2|nr:hypothetical protein [Desertibacillus haloalkaliphilus]MBU8908064.1 30S ribosomal protein S1 [Desertibacillus haloalkaliphilus]
MSAKELEVLSNEQINELTKLDRNNEMGVGVVKNLGIRTLPVLDDETGEIVEKEVQVVILLTRGNTKVYCLVEEFAEYQYKSLVKFVGQQREFVVDHIDLQNRIAFVSVKKAEQQKSEQFWDMLEFLDKEGKLQDEVFEGVVQSHNPATGNLFIKVQGTETYMDKKDWDYDYIADVETIFNRGQVINVKVLHFNRESGVIRVSRKDTFVDPFIELENYVDDFMAGKVDDVDDVHGIFVQLDLGVRVKAEKPRHLEEPFVGEVVTCRLKSVDTERRRARVVIVNYPNGKKELADPGSFLFN